MKKLLAVVLVSVLLFSCFIHPAFSTTIFSDGFESGDLSAWTGTTTTGGGTITVESLHPHHGSYNVKSSVGAPTSYAMVYKTFAGQTTCFARLYFKLDSMPTWNDGVKLYISPRLRTSSTTLVNVVIRKESTGYRWGYWGTGVPDHGWGVNHNYGPIETINAGQWYCIEVKVVISSTNGEIRLYIDGTEKASDTNINTGTTPATNLYVGIYNDQSGAPTSVIAYYDCVVVSDTYIGPEVSKAWYDIETWNVNLWTMAWRTIEEWNIQFIVLVCHTVEEWFVKFWTLEAIYIPTAPTINYGLIALALACVAIAFSILFSGEEKKK